MFGLWLAATAVTMPHAERDPATQGHAHQRANDALSPADVATLVEAKNSTVKSMLYRPAKVGKVANSGGRFASP